ncbi:Shugoshin-1 [Acorus gramineus]|uniref:Shugoshin-1 n=1 Tax=Acorus gramineus TaxID=55184 RepID=A0AAV9AYQ7_ACOGR|nr:Shugoshin-1 [Acorus gramineus]
MKDIEIQKLQFELQSALQQNQLLALSNSQMLAESNLGKDRLKAMQHELGCVKAVHKVKTLELEEMAKKQQCIGVTVDMKDEVPKHEEMTEETRLVNLSSPPLDQSLCSISLTSHHVATNGKDNTRRTRRQQQSVTFKCEICQTADDVKGDIEPLIPSMHGDTITELDCPASASSTVCNSGDPVKSGRDFQSSIGRPSRRAAEKVKSYKEPPLKIKMRRSE